MTNFIVIFYLRSKFYCKGYWFFVIIFIFILRHIDKTKSKGRRRKKPGKKRKRKKNEKGWKKLTNLDAKRKLDSHTSDWHRNRKVRFPFDLMKAKTIKLDSLMISWSHKSQSWIRLLFYDHRNHKVGFIYGSISAWITRLDSFSFL